MKITVISFSGRKNGNCKNIAKEILKFHKENTTVFYDFSEMSLTPCGKCDAECFHQKLCPHDDLMYQIYDDLCSSDLAYFIAPNHSNYPAANFFIFNERCTACFWGKEDLLEKYLSVPKKFIVVSNSEKEHFFDVFRLHTDSAPNVLFLSPKTYGKSSIDGDLVTSEQAQKDLLLFIC